MTEIAKCRCGAEAEWQISTDGKVGRWCRRCGIHGPWCDFEELMDAAWNSLMRPRPVAEWDPPVDDPADEMRMFCGNAELGSYRELAEGEWETVCLVAGESRTLPDEPSARAWLEARVRAAGFEVRDA